MFVKKVILAAVVVSAVLGATVTVADGLGHARVDLKAKLKNTWTFTLSHTEVVAIAAGKNVPLPLPKPVLTVLGKIGEKLAQKDFGKGVKVTVRLFPPKVKIEAR